MKLTLFSSILVFFELYTPNVAAQWVKTGLYGGAINCFAFSGENIFVGTQGGVFLSTDNGTNWREMNNGIPVVSVSALKIIGTNIFLGNSLIKILIKWEKCLRCTTRNGFTKLIKIGNK